MMYNKTVFRLVSIVLTLSLLISTAFVSAYAMEYTEQSFSDEYKGSPYYQKLMTALDDSKDKTMMEKTLAVALSQEGYKNYATTGIDIEEARNNGLLWTGAELRMNDNQTGNTEYTRWAQRYVMERDEDSQYADYDWCAIFVSWCMYQAGYYDKSTLKKYYYSYYADSREAVDADMWIASFNNEYETSWYTPVADKNLDRWGWEKYDHRNIDPLEIPYKPGGLVYFSWDGEGNSFDHVAIVVNYDTDTHVLTYTNGNSEGQVITRQIDLDVEESFRGTAFTKNSNRILGYGEYDEIKPLEQKEITTDTPVIDWSKDSASGIKIQTNSDSKIVAVSVDDEYLGSIIESNMTFHYGKIAIGKSELVGLSTGKHKMLLVFDDGVLEVTLNVLRDYLRGDANMDGKVDILDVTAIQQKLAGLGNNSFDSKASDIDGNKLNIADATLIQLYLAGLDNRYNIGEKTTG